MTNPDDWLPYDAALGDYARQAESLLADVKFGAEEARWSFKWEHPRFQGKSVTEVDVGALAMSDAQIVVAHRYGFETWPDLVEFTKAVGHNDATVRFEAAVEAVVSGDLTTLDAMLRDDPELVRARSSRRHRATLLHYVGANGVEGARQKTPGNAVDVAKTLLDAGAEVDAVADLYGAKCTTMSMLVSSEHPAKAGLQAALAETLLDYGAAFDGPGSGWQSALLTALTFGYLPTARALERRGAPVDTLPAAAGLGRLDAVARLLPSADARTRHIALALAAQHGQVPALRLLLDANEDPNRYNPEGYHAHSTPLHQAVWADRADAVKLLISYGARLDIKDTVYDATPLDWAIHGGRHAIADYLRAKGAPTT